MAYVQKFRHLQGVPSPSPHLPNPSYTPAHRSVQLGIGGEHLEVVEEFEYLDSTISQDSSLKHEVDKLISKASPTYCSLYKWYGAESS